MKHLLIAITLFLCISTSAMAARYYAPPQYIQTSVSLSQGEDKISGTVKNATGSLSFNKSTKSLKNLKLAIDTQTLSSNLSKDFIKLEEKINSRAHPEIVFIQSGAASFDTKDKANIKGTIHFKGKRQQVEAIAILEAQQRSALTFSITLQIPEGEGDSQSTLEFSLNIKAIRT